MIETGAARLEVDRGGDEAPFEVDIVPCSQQQDTGLRYLVFLQAQDERTILIRQLRDREERLLKTLEQAEAASVAKEQFLNNMSHEIHSHEWRFGNARINDGNGFKS